MPMSRISDEEGNTLPMPISSCFTNASLLCTLPGLEACVQEFQRHWEGPLFASCSKPLSPELPRVWPPKGSLVHLGVLCPFRQGACAFHQHRSTIGLACARRLTAQGASSVLAMGLAATMARAKAKIVIYHSAAASSPKQHELL